MAKKRTKKINLSAEERRFGVILEDVDSKLDLVIEGHKALDKKIDKNNKNLEEFRQETDYRFKILTEMTAKNSEDIVTLTEMTAKNSEDIVTLTEMTAGNSENIEIMKSDIEIIKNSLKKKVDAEEFELLEKRVALLENKIARAKI